MLRKDAFELIETPNEWTQREKHQESGIRKIPGLLHECLESCGITVSKDKIKKMDTYQELVKSLRTLGRGGDERPICQMSDVLIQELTE
jgi:hypothetical protein